MEPICFSSLLSRFKGLLLDAYGVFWSGGDAAVFPQAKEAMREAVSKGAVVGILTNAAQLKAKEEEKFTRHGLLKGVHYHFLVTSGEIARTLFFSKRLPFTLMKRRYWLFGGTHPKYKSHIGIFQDSELMESEDIREADFIYISVPHIQGEDQVDPELFRDSVNKIEPKLPMVCVNPDRFAHEGKPVRSVVRQGSIAQMYEERGGSVLYLGKPYREAYDSVMREFERFGIFSSSEVVMVGDTPETDIRGANHYGMASLLVLKTGMMADRIKEKGFETALGELKALDIPHYTIEQLSK